MDKQEFITTVNNLRKSNKNNWYSLNTIINNKIVSVKGFNTYLQILKVNDTRFGGTCDISVKQFNKELESVYDYTLR